MDIDGKRWIMQPKKTMKKLALPWQLKLYKLRFVIEFDFRSLKLVPWARESDAKVSQWLPRQLPECRLFIRDRQVVFVSLVIGVG